MRQFGPEKATLRRDELSGVNEKKRASCKYVYAVLVYCVNVYLNIFVGLFLPVNNKQLRSDVIALLNLFL